MKASHRIAGIVAIVVSSVLLIAFTFLYDWFPVQATDAAGQIDTLYKWMLAASLPFFVIIVALIVFCVVEFRANPADPVDKDGEPIHGSTKLELIWTAIPLVVVVALGIYAWVVLDNVEARAPKSETMFIKVVGQQFAWSYEYETDGDKKIGVKTSGDLVVPVNKPLVFNIVSSDVMHSFWVPATRLKRDATPGFNTPLNFTPNRIGEYEIVCAELCGVGHATMRSEMRVVSQKDFDKWLIEQKGGKVVGADKGAGADKGPDGKAIFASAGCGSCHALAATGDSGAAGPPLDGLALSEAAALEAVVDPGKTIADGYSDIMPPTFKDSLSEEELDALAKFLAEATK